VKNLIAVLVLLVAGCAKDAPLQDGHRQAAAELLELLEVEMAIQNMAVLMADSMVEQHPKTAIYRDVLIDWSIETMSWAELGDQFVSMYVDAYSEQELRDLIAFYRSPTGRKSIRLMPELMQRGAEIGNHRAMERRAELEARIQERTMEVLDQNPGRQQ